MAVELEYCEFVTGLPPRFFNLLLGFETTGEWSEFYTDGNVEVNWGTGKWLLYKPGVVFGKQTYPNSGVPVIVRADEENPVTKIYFGNGAGYDNVFLQIDIVRAVDLIDVTKMCYRLESMHTFDFFGNNQIESFESAWEDCTELTHFDGMDTTRAITFEKAWKNCNKLNMFPNIYASECLTVKQAWMGCTSMMEFPIIDVSICENFESAWHGNTMLKYFPYIDTGAGTNFDHAWAYTQMLTYMPALNFENAESMNYTFAYMYAIRNMPIINSSKCTEFVATFTDMCGLECIAGLDTMAISSRDFTADIFKHCNSLVEPDEIEQERLRDGWLYENPYPCYFDAGRSVFFVHCNVPEDFDCRIVSFEIVGNDFEVDWGDGLFLPCNEGIKVGMPIDQKGINIRSEEPIDQIKFLTDTFTSVEVKRGHTLTSVEGMCQDLELLEYFEILGIVNTTNFDDILSGCINLTEVGEFDMSYALSLDRTFKYCSSLTCIDDHTPGCGLTDTDITDHELDMSSSLSFDSTFYGCTGIVHLQNLITTSGQVFNNMFRDMISFECLDGVDTRNKISTSNMFYNTPELLRPTVNEIRRITLDGKLYYNFGNCAIDVMIMATGNGSSMRITTNGKTFVDWGDGNVIEYPQQPVIEGTPVDSGEVYIFGEFTEIDFVNDNFVTVDFMSVHALSSMENMFNGKQNLTTFTFSGDSFMTSYKGAFANSSLVTFVPPEDFEYGDNFDSMFLNTSNLTSVGALNTYNGRYFEHMFDGSNIKCIYELNTCKAIFESALIYCTGEMLDCVPATEKGCDDELGCDDDFVTCDGISCQEGSMLQACNLIPCDGYIDKFLGSTMFDNSSINSPDISEQDKIMNQWHYIGGVPC